MPSRWAPGVVGLQGYRIRSRSARWCYPCVGVRPLEFPELAEPSRGAERIGIGSTTATRRASAGRPLAALTLPFQLSEAGGPRLTGTSRQARYEAASTVAVLGMSWSDPSSPTCELKLGALGRSVVLAQGELGLQVGRPLGEPQTAQLAGVQVALGAEEDALAAEVVPFEFGGAAAGDAAGHRVVGGFGELAGLGPVGADEEDDGRLAEQLVAVQGERPGGEERVVLLEL